MGQKTEAAIKWVEALRSGEYEQATGCLRKVSMDDGWTQETSYCCLGVAALTIDRLTEDGVIEVQIADGDGEVTDSFDVDLPPDLLSIFGLSDGEQRELICANDERKYSFERIAQMVEEGWGGSIALPDLTEDERLAIEEAAQS